MSSKTIAILTDWGTAIGSGHIQRMTSLLWYLINRNIHAYIVLDHLPPFFPDALKAHWRREFIPKPDIIIRDMRDSTAREIRELREISRVLIIDDSGEGREAADYLIDMLPAAENTGANKKKSPDNLFIYGYGFMNSLQTIIEKSHASEEFTEQESETIVEKKIDFTIYPGFHPSEGYTDFLIGLLPADSEYAILRGDRSYLKIKGKSYGFDGESHAEILLSSRVLISHFGILLYEAYLSECRIVCINPSFYHSRLAERVKDHLRIENLGEHTGLKRERAQRIIRESMQKPVSDRVNVQDVYHTVLENLERFCNYLMSLL